MTKTPREKALENLARQFDAGKVTKKGWKNVCVKCGVLLVNVGARICIGCDERTRI